MNMVASTRLVKLTFLVFFLAGCSTIADPVTQADMKIQAKQDLEAIFKVQEPLDRPITLHEAMARAVRYNLDKRLKWMEEALVQRQFDVSRYDLLPSAVASTGYLGRNNDSGAKGMSLPSGEEYLRYSTSSERNRFVSGLNMAWNVLDFGVSYLGARQQSNRTLVVAEQHRKVTQNIIRDVRTAYWRAVAAERILKTIDPLIEGVNKAREDSKNLEKTRNRSPMEALTYQRSLVEALNQLKRERRDLVTARNQLAALMNVSPNQTFTLEVPAQAALLPPDLTVKPETLESQALSMRPELREEAYQKRIGADETRRAMLRMLPGLEFNTVLNYDTNKYMFNNSWADYSLRVSWNLFSLISGPVAIKAAAAQEQVNKARRLALSMAVLTQVHVAWLRYRQAVDEWKTARELDEIEARILQQIQAQVKANRHGSSEEILARVRAEVARIRTDQAFVEVQDTIGLILNTIGTDPTTNESPATDLSTLAEAIRKTEDVLLVNTPL